MNEKELLSKLKQAEVSGEIHVKDLEEDLGLISAVVKASFHHKIGYMIIGWLQNIQTEKRNIRIIADWLNKAKKRN